MSSSLLVAVTGVGTTRPSREDLARPRACCCMAHPPPCCDEIELLRYPWARDAARSGYSSEELAATQGLESSIMAKVFLHALEALIA